jgi:uncharacterized membrane-anchored protein YhcB (DUF1043 family)
VPGLSGGPEGWDEESSSEGVSGVERGEGAEVLRDGRAREEGRPAGAEDAEATKGGGEGAKEDAVEEGEWRPLDLRRDFRLILGLVGVAVGALVVRTMVGTVRKAERLQVRLEETEREARRVRMSMESTVKRERDIAESSLENVEKLHGMVQERNHKIAALRRQLKDAESKVLETVARAFESLEAFDDGEMLEEDDKEDEKTRPHEGADARSKVDAVEDRMKDGEEDDVQGEHEENDESQENEGDERSE